MSYTQASEAAERMRDWIGLAPLALFVGAFLVTLAALSLLKGTKPEKRKGARL